MMMVMIMIEIWGKAVFKGASKANQRPDTWLDMSSCRHGGVEIATATELD
jgi:hypothetical protein